MSYVNNLRTFVRVHELGSMSAAARDLRISPAVASNRILELEKHLGARLFNRTTRSLKPTGQGELFYKGAIKILDTIDEVEGSIADVTQKPRGSIFVSAPLGLGKKLIAPLVPAFKEAYPDINVRLRLSDRKVDLTNEGLDAAFVLGEVPDSEMRLRPIHSFRRILCAAPSYVKAHGMPANGDDLTGGGHACLMLRYPGAAEFFWTLTVDGRPKRFDISPPLESDDGDVLTAWALAGCGIINKPVFEIASHLEDGSLVPVALETPPSELPFSCIFPHKRLQDPKVRLFIDHAIEGARTTIEESGAEKRFEALAAE